MKNAAAETKYWRNKCIDETARSVADLDRNFIIFLMWWIECEVEQQMLMWILKVRWQTSLSPRSLTLLRGATEQYPTLIVGTELASEKRKEKWMISDLSSCTFKHVRDIPGHNILDTKRKIMTWSYALYPRYYCNAVAPLLCLIIMLLSWD